MYRAYFDGACLPQNPGGMATCGVVITTPDGSEVLRDGIIVAEKGGTNNTAEWSGLILALEKLLRLGASHAEVVGDSQLVVNQFNGKWAVRAPHLHEYYERARRLARRFKSLEVKWIPREQNLADYVAHAVFVSYMEKRQWEKAEKSLNRYRVESINPGVYRVISPGGDYTVDLNRLDR